MEAEDAVTIKMANFRNHKISDLFSMLDFAVRCKIEDVLSLCVKLLKNRLSCENVIQIFQKILLCKLEMETMEDAENLLLILDEMENFCFKFMLRNGNELLKSDAFISMSRHNVVKLIQSDNLNCSELDVFLAVVRWATAKTAPESNNQPIEGPKLRSAMNQIFPHIRFPLLSGEDLTHHVARYKILTPDELLNLYSYICSREDLKPESPFICRPRVSRSRLCEIPRESELDVKRSNDVRARRCFVDVESPQIIKTKSMNKSADNLEESVPHISNAVRLQPDAQTPGPSGLTRPSTANSFTNYVPSGSNCVSPSPPSVPPSDLSISTNRTKKMNCASLKRKRVIFDVRTDESDDNTPVRNKKNCEIIPWGDYVRRFATAKDLHTIREIKLENVKTVFNFKTNNAVELIPKVTMPSLQEAYFDLTDDQFEKSFSDFVRLFDIRKFIFFTKSSSSNNWKLEDIWNMGIRITIIVNGVKILEVNKPTNELTISFRNYSDEIMSGLNKTDKLLKLNLIKTDVPKSEIFPARHLKKVLFYYVWAYNNTKGADVGQFVRACVNLEEFSCYALATGGVLKRKKDLIILDLAKDFVSGNLLKRLAICHSRLTVSTKSVKSGVKELYLDCCFWSDKFVDIIHDIFPNLKRIALRQANQSLKTSKVTLTMLSNLLQIPSLEWVRIWGMNWEDTSNNVSSTSAANLRTRGRPSQIKKVTYCKTVMGNCGLIGATNFILEKNDGLWESTVLNDQEPEDVDGGFWDHMDELNFKYYQLENVYKHCQTYQNNFEYEWNDD